MTVYCGQTVGRIKMKLSMQVGLGPGHTELDGDPAPLPQRGTAPQFLAHISVAAKWLHESTCNLVWSGYQSTRHGHLVTQSCRHTVNSSPVNSSHTRLITQSTRHKRAHNKTTSTSLHAVRRHPETVLNTDGIITAICVTLMYTVYYRSW